MTNGSDPAGATQFLRRAEVSDAAQAIFGEDVAELGFVMNASRLWAYQPEAMAGLFKLMGCVTSGRPFSARERGILVAACASALGDSCCALAWGTKLSSQFSIVVTTVKVLVVLLVIVVGAFYVKAANYTPFIPPPQTDQSGSGINQSLLSLFTGAHSSHYGWYGVLAGASIVFFAFIGFDIVATMAEETKNPQRDVPRGILATLGIVTVLYVAVSVVLFGVVGGGLAVALGF